MYPRIKEERLLHNLTQKQIAEKLEIKYQVYQRYENGKIECPGHIIIKLADIYNIMTDYLYGRTDIKQLNEQKKM